MNEFHNYYSKYRKAFEQQKTSASQILYNGTC